MQTRGGIFFLVMFFLLVTLQGCETLKGMKRDIQNIKVKATRVPNYDKWLQEHAW